MPRMIDFSDTLKIIASHGLLSKSLEVELRERIEREDIGIDLVRCEECKWWQNPCYGFGAYGYCSDGERRMKDADLS